MKQGVFGFYTDRSERLVETLRIDFYERTYSHICDMPRSRIGKAEYGKTIPEVLVPQEMFAKLVRIVQEHMSGMFCSGGFCGLSEEEGDRTYEWELPRSGAYVQRLPHDRVWAAIRLEADGAELARVAACGDYEREDYFDAEALCAGIRAFCAGKLSVRSFADWCIVLSHAFSGGGPYRGDRYLWELYDNIGYFFDGLFFLADDCSDAAVRREMGERLAMVRWYAHLRDDLLARRRPTPFEKNGVVVYCSYAFYAKDDTRVWFFCVADCRKGKVNYFQVDDPVFDEAVCYTFLSSREFEDLPGTYFRFTLDRTLDVDAQKEGG